jgi:imidazole glycerol-phosphate synthase subunit HisH
MGRQTIAVIDYGMGNLHSVASALAHVAGDASISVTADAKAIRAADRVIFPGVGAIRDCMGEIRRLGLDSVVASVIAAGKPVLGICVGMQALMEHSEENAGVDCLGILPGRVRYFGKPLLDVNGERLKVPHMGWSPVTFTAAHQAHPLWRDITDGSRFYFVHSYYVDLADQTHCAATCQYGVTFAAAATRGNLFAVQFHPEKSHTAGLQLLSNFVAWQP